MESFVVFGEHHVWHQSEEAVEMCLRNPRWNEQ